MTGMDTRIGYPNEHLAPETPDEMASPMYATGVGLVIQGAERFSRDKSRNEMKVTEPVAVAAAETAESMADNQEPEEHTEIEEPVERPAKKPRNNGFLKRIQDWFEGDEI
jgi:cell division protein FtsA